MSPSTVESGGVGFIIAEIAVFFIAAIVILCCGRKPEDGAGADGRPVAAAAPLPAPAAVVELGYFPYSAEGRRASEKLECAICLEVLVDGEVCSEVPACRHLFHRDCIGVWMKTNNTTCPLCRHDIVTGSEQLSTADDMV